MRINFNHIHCEVDFNRQGGFFNEGQANSRLIKVKLIPYRGSLHFFTHRFGHETTVIQHSVNRRTKRTKFVRHRVNANQSEQILCG